MTRVKSVRARLLSVAAVLIVLGALSFILQPGPPDGECAPEGTISSGFVDEDKDCPLTIESWDEIADYESSPKPFRIAGLVLVVAGLGVGAVALIRRPKNA